MVKSKKEKKVIFIISCLCLYYSTKANIGTELGGAVSQLVPHTRKMLHIKALPSPLLFFSLQLPWQDSRWHKAYPSITLHLHDNGNKDILGYSAGLSITWNFFSSNDKFLLKIGTGLAYLSKKYDFYTNQANVSIGSNFNNVSYAFAGYNFNRMTAGIGVIHYSAGALSMPNLGLNYPFIMLNYYIRHPRIVKHSDNNTYFLDSGQVTIESGMGISAMMPPGAPSSPVLLLAIYKKFQINDIISFAPSLYSELNFRALTFYYLFKWQQTEGSLPTTHRLTTGLRIGPELILSIAMGHVTLNGTAGWYVYNKLPAPASLFIRLYLIYWISNRVGLGIMVKAHLMAAEFTSLNVAIRL